MTKQLRLPIFLAVFLSAALTAISQDLPQDKKTAADLVEQGDLIMAETKAMDQAREMYVNAANFDTTNVKANFQAGRFQVETIGKELAVKYFLRVYRQSPNYQFDLEYWIARSYHFGLKFDAAIDFYTRYRNKASKRPDYKGKDFVPVKEVDRFILACKNGKEFVADPKPYSIVNIGSEINSEFEDFAPVLNDNEDEIVFTTRRQDGNTYENVDVDNKHFEDIFISTKKGGKWASAKNIGPTVNTKFHDSNLTLSPDGKLLFIYKDDNGGDIFESRQNADGSWGTPTPLPGVINSSYRESSVSVTADGSILYFASDRPGGYGGSDIYMCTKDAKGEWSRVKNLGTVINTDVDEDGPFIASDAQTLYFSSEGHKGMGGFDVFKSTLKNLERSEWTEPENIGYPINTPDDDIFFTTSKDGKRYYYSSVRDGGLGYSDIYIITASEVPKKQPDVIAKKEEPKKEEPKKEEPKKEEPKKEEPKKEEPKKEEPRKEQPKKEETRKEEPKKEQPKKEEPKKIIQPIRYIVKIIDAETKQPLDSKIRMMGLRDKVVVGAIDQGGGVTEFSIKSTTAKEYQITVEKDGYIFQSVNAKLPAATAEAKTIDKTIEMRKLVVNAVSILRNIYFDFQKATFRVESYSELNRLETMMKQNPALQVEISGHADYVGSKAFNKTLSLRRANAVKSFLTSKGIDTRRIKTVGYGEERPIASNDDEKDGRELNRRVEFKVLGN
ncbi:hypothetical protein WSM22_32500 [Cytophagales bacterium WSM2-2]|nr:hypothetical protein WSM22_32500 [Cytophagales bacterium WSM2-2]